jgi:hypothetical protein
MNPLSPNQILRNLEHGYFMTHQEQAEAAQYIRQLQQSNAELLEALQSVIRDGIDITCGDITLVAPHVKNIKAAIAKAEGSV